MNSKERNVEIDRISDSISVGREKVAKFFQEVSEKSQSEKKNILDTAVDESRKMASGRTNGAGTFTK